MPACALCFLADLDADILGCGSLAPEYVRWVTLTHGLAIRLGTEFF